MSYVWAGQDFAQGGGMVTYKMGYTPKAPISLLITCIEERATREVFAVRAITTSFYVLVAAIMTSLKTRVHFNSDMPPVFAPTPSPATSHAICILHLPTTLHIIAYDPISRCMIYVQVGRVFSPVPWS